MSIRADMIGPRRLIPSGPFGRPVFALIDESQPLTEPIGPITTNGTINGVVPSCHRPPPPQPALVIRDELLGKSVAEPMFSEAKPPMDMTTPQHEHARLTAKKKHLLDKLEAHQRAMHPTDHPEVMHRSKVLSQVMRNLEHLEGKGVTSKPEHHDSWRRYFEDLQHIDPEKAKQLHPKEIKTAIEAHSTLAKKKSSAVSKAKSDDWISEKIRLLMHEGKPQKQAIAIAYSMAGRSKKDKAEKSLRLYVR